MSFDLPVLVRAASPRLHRVAAAVRDVLYPPRCVRCGRFGRGFLCEPCHGLLVPASGPGVCRNCSALWEGDDFCPACLHWDALDGARAAYRHEGAARALVHALKYGRVRAVAGTLAPEIDRLLAAEQLTVAFPVPLHRRRVRSRGFNQADEILRHLSLVSGTGRLVRTRKTRSQVGLDLVARRGNVAGAFEYRGEPLAGARVALIDDVLTTGATANECARVLKDFGASRVVAITFARANPPDRAWPNGGDA